LKITDAALRTTEQMVNMGEANASDLLEAQVQQQQARVAVTGALNEYRRAWTALITTAGVCDLPPARLVGPLDADAPVLDFPRTLAAIIAGSPEIKAAQMEVRRDEVTVLRERVQPIPNMYVQTAVGYNALDGGPGIDAMVDFNVPVWNTNQGNILQAQSDLVRARARVRRIELELQKRLADEFATYHTSLDVARTYRDESLPRAKKAYDLLLESYQRRRAAWPQVLAAQRLWFQLRTEYTLALLGLRRSEVEIEGYLLEDGLHEPQGPFDLGNINVTTEPR
jgi:cobalt-zinc-cadmium efflux system outer membrane protein